MSPYPVYFSQVAHHFGSPDGSTFGHYSLTPSPDNPRVLTTGCPSCGGEMQLLRVDDVVKVFCVADEDPCSPNDIAKRFGLSVAELEALKDDIVVTPGASHSPDPIVWEDVRAEADVDRARVLYRYILQTGKDVIYAKETNWLLWEGAQWKATDETRIRAFAHEVGDQMYDAAECALASSRALLHKADGTKPSTPEEHAAKDRKADASRLHSASLFYRKTVYIDAVVRKELPAMNAGKGSKGEDLLVRRSITEFDRDSDVLGVRNGVVDLRTGKLRPYRKEDLITKAVDIDYDPDAEAPLWERYLSEVFIAEDGSPDPEFVDFMRRLIGYAATGHTREHVLPVFFGRGSNGKSVFLEVMSAVFAEHATTTPFETFVDKPAGGIPNDIAALRGARLVMASEGSAAKPMDEAVIKRLTGGDTISARFLNREFFQFVPSFTILMATNYKPTFRGQDEGLWRRVKLIPFRAYFPVDISKEAPSPFIRERDKSLKEKLLADEQAGILAWAVRGAMEWYRTGLAVPASIEKETSEFRTESDSLGEFIADVLDVTGEHSDIVFLSDLFPAYTAWAKEADENGHTFGRKLFSQMMGERPGIVRAMRGGKVMYRGMKILSMHEQTARRKAAERALRSA